MDCKFTTEMGTVTVDEEILLKVAGYSALDCYGIVGMASKRTTDGLVELLGRENLGRGGHPPRRRQCGRGPVHHR